MDFLPILLEELLMFYHSYDNINDIEPDFLISLNHLYEDKAPSFDFIKDKELNELDSKYYLFFGSSDNSPKAFLKAKTLVSKNRLLPFIKYKYLRWSGPSTINDSFYIDPKYQKEFKIHFTMIKNNIEKKLALKKQTVISQFQIESKELTSVTLVKSLFKSSKNYEGYINSLSLGTQKEIKALFKEYRNLNIEKYDSLKECFTYKTKNKETYSELKKLTPYKLLKEVKHRVIAIENNEQVLAFCILIRNDSGHVFFHTNNLLNIINNQLLLNLAILNFFDEEDVLYLHPLEKTKFTEYFKALNFTKEVDREFLI